MQPLIVFIALSNEFTVLEAVQELIAQIRFWRWLVVRHYRGCSLNQETPVHAVRYHALLACKFRMYYALQS